MTYRVEKVTPLEDRVIITGKKDFAHEFTIVIHNDEATALLDALFHAQHSKGDSIAFPTRRGQEEALLQENRHTEQTFADTELTIEKERLEFMIKNEPDQEMKVILQGMLSKYK